MIVTSVKPHIHYLTAKTPAEIISDFKKSLRIFLISYFSITAVILIAGYFGQDTFEMSIFIPVCISILLLFGISILPKIYETAKVLNDRGVMDIAPSLLVSLQFILNIAPTSVIIPIFLQSKCSEVEKRRSSKKQ